MTLRLGARFFALPKTVIRSQFLEEANDLSQCAIFLFSHVVLSEPNMQVNEQALIDKARENPGTKKARKRFTGTHLFFFLFLSFTQPRHCQVH